MNTGQPPGGGGAWGQQPPGAPQLQQPAAPAAPGYPQQPAAPQAPPPGVPAQGAPPQYQPPQQPAQQPQPGAPPQGAPPQYQVPAAQPNFQANPFAGLNSGDGASGMRHPYLTDGHHHLKIAAIKFVPARSGKQQYIIESDIIASNNPAMAPGMRVSSFINMSDADSRGRHMACFVSSVFGFDPEQLPKDSPVAPWTDQHTQRQETWEYYAVQSLHESQPWAGIEYGAHVKTVVTKRKGLFSLHNWKPLDKMVIPPQMEPINPEVVAIRAAEQGDYPQQPVQPTAAPAPPVPGAQPNWAPPPVGGGGGGFNPPQ